jgi:hypothetical protein
MADYPLDDFFALIAQNIKNNTHASVGLTATFLSGPPLTTSNVGVPGPVFLEYSPAMTTEMKAPSSRLVAPTSVLFTPASLRGWAYNGTNNPAIYYKIYVGNSSGYHLPGHVTFDNLEIDCVDPTTQIPLPSLSQIAFTPQASDLVSQSKGVITFLCPDKTSTVTLSCPAKSVG